MKNGEVDFAIITTPAEVESGLKMVELKPFYEVLVGGRTFTALASQNLSLKELNNYPLISLSDESMTRAFYRQFFLDHGAGAEAGYRGCHHRPDADPCQK